MAADLRTSSTAFQNCKAFLGGGVSSGLRASMQPHPLFVERGFGPRVWDVAGQEYVDFVMGWGPLIAGHSHPSIVAAVADMLPRMQIGMKVS
ncbi:hypothetical protein CH253_17500 [Rhodococcus sp. 06-156-3C]|uniref:aminotransferase class III-fold pyridoxal phosphate-dependent enzyme n=1 Tax=Nocardiaceae TaxID=85025 RepID=UPI0009B892EE|nr:MULTISPECIES: aminotransferase class III-fold pyridoxal phosphate-dependent enzyme [Rhodococcus]OZD18264.1 hypothetical protein CH280_06825 [Rhodococcus sp. 06-156-4C]OZD18862.1 hypothetical protein CH253_17500 [Rhodococcus sp. 06-156-3C]OZD22372.1 hypothetical protein CH248_09085 [Rhodococcus sp. 06-156-4a]OZD33956.1 hypothetical protein CH247_07615 [Rhodococcus sp. 06-156-3b]OZD38693.1 hypothetical protein CH284_06035 [Rhodococcus sp. 06-156-3]